MTTMGIKILKKIITKKIPLLKQRQILPDELAKIRKFFHRKQNYTCPVLKIEYYTEDMVVDHAHKANANNLGKKEEAGLIRGVIHRQANTMEGKITNSFIRCGLHKFDITLPEFLRNLADFIERPPMTRFNYVHPTEKKKDKVLKKNSIKKLVKRFREEYPNRKLPDVLIYKLYTKGKKKGKERPKKISKGLEKLYSEFGLEPEFKKG